MSVRSVGCSLARILACVVATFALAAPARGQHAPLVETVVVTATSLPDDETEVGAATTVIDRARIEAFGATSVLDLLRLVPGVDVLRSGEDGALTSLFLRGSNSTQALVLVDGVRANSPYFSGYDFSALTTDNVERVEVVRGPFSSLYGSDAVGGVVQIFTRGATVAPAGTGAFEAGGSGWRSAAMFASSGAGPLSATATYRDVASDGSRTNSDWKQRNGSLRLEGAGPGSLRGAIELSVMDGESGVPGAVGAESPRARGSFREERIAVPVSFSPWEGHEATVLLARVRSAPTYRNPDDPFFGSSDTDARTLQARFADSWTVGSHRLAAFASWEEWTVSAGGSSETFLDGARTRTWGAGIQDSFALGGGWHSTAGLRVDRHGEFGGAISPRLSVLRLSRDRKWKLRASAGSAFRAPSVGELYYPFVGNADLDRERSRSYEAGIERYVAGGRAELSLFWNDFRDLIVYDFAASRNENVGRARTRGAEAALRRPLGRRTEVDLGYTYLTAEDRTSGERLVRRPRHRAYVATAIRPLPALLATVRASFVGRRPDRDGVTFAPVTSPSHLRVDLHASWDARRLRPFVRVDNVTDRRYEEADGFPASGIRFSAGVELRVGAPAARGKD